MPILEYLKSVNTTHSTGEASEHSYRSALEGMLEGVGGEGVRALNEPKRVRCGAPDLIVEREGVPVGHIECKDIGVDLGKAERSEQITRYRAALPNLILTDYLEFRWYTDGVLRDTARLGNVEGPGHISSDAAARDSVQGLLRAFFDAQQLTVGDPADLARRMASKTRLLCSAIEKILADSDDDHSYLGELHDSYRKVLFNDLDVEAFADMQAQTAAYGLFAARCMHSGPPELFTRESATFTGTIPFLQQVFAHIAGQSADERIVWIIDSLALLLAQADMAAVLENFGSATRKEDPIIHFYEQFLAEYDSKLKKKRGVYYTPQPVVSYIVRSVDWVLRSRFHLSDGLADTSTVDIENGDGLERNSPRVLVLDPAAGTGTFLREVIAHIRDDLTRRGLAGTWASYVPDHLLPRLFGFELLMAAYTICHLKLAMEINSTSEHQTLQTDKRLSVFLTNSLSPAHEETADHLFASAIAREANEADAVKRDQPVMVIIGNPPYSGHSANTGNWITGLMRGRMAEDPYNYFSVNGQPLGERNSKWVNDDYVKFIRFAQWRINQTGEGVLGFVTNHSYLNNPTFCGMRESLLEAFDEIWVLDLHGNAKLKERSPDGSRDDNVFDIEQGVAIGIFVKYKGGSKDLATVHHADLWGERGDSISGKYAWLAEHGIDNTHWVEVSPQAPDYFFAPRDFSLSAEYDGAWKLTDILPVNSVGVVTSRDKLTIQWSEAEMRLVVAKFANLSELDAREHFGLPPDSDWKVADAQADVHSQDASHVKPILYRPFDRRYTYYTGTSGGFISRPRQDVMRHMLEGPNIGLIVCRQQSQQGEWSLVSATHNIIESGAISNKTKEINKLFPLYHYPPEVEIEGQASTGAAGKKPNLASAFTAAVAKRTSLEFISDGQGNLVSEFGPEDVFHYIYAVLHSPQYRRRYADFLKSDFPRIPLPTDASQFQDLASLGKRLTALHLMTEYGEALPSFPVGGSGEINKVVYGEPCENSLGKVWISDTQYFDGVTAQTWQFTIGGYKPAEKWLKDRKGRTLNFEDVKTYQRLCAALSETQQLMVQIDETIEDHGGWPFGAAQADSSQKPTDANIS